ncbi:serine/threonine-protein kinase nekl-3-like [Paramacrobiotus metropolitanus]|uniref:serine/threonine-protein kinase nekl-3-like n=1 Tax=Paramacrobiotus metropolitanus TaxID=2943436 RepID=UPI002445F4A1|nr:serine/threonine-protein kinase nekl-3-like [Paramacrobiotus metropolitanus]
METSVVESFGSDCEYDYSAKDLIGMGSFGRVYKAKLTNLSNELIGKSGLAVKIINLDKDTDLLTDPKKRSDLIERWKKVLYELKHDHLVQYHKVSLITAVGGITIEFLMDYYKDDTLRVLLDNREKSKKLLKEKTVVCHAVQISDALAFLHQNRTIHGDLKPSNVLVKRRQHNHDHLVISDLDDLVVMQQGSTKPHDIATLKASIRYMSPEMLKKFGLVDEKLPQTPGRMTDIWSFGCILIDLLNHCFGIREKLLVRTDVETSALEYYEVQDTTTPSMFATKIIDGYVPVVNEKISPDFGDLVQHCLNVHSKQRPLAEDVKTALLRIRGRLVPNEQEKEALQPCICSVP